MNQTAKPNQQNHTLPPVKQSDGINPHNLYLLSRDEQLQAVIKARGKEKYRLIINSPLADQLVPQLHPQDIYLTVNELGANDVIELLTLATPEQITLLLDLDCWDRDRLSPIMTLHWLELILNMGEAKARQLIRELDAELWALFLRRHMTITRGLEAFDDDDADNARRLEGLYDIQYHDEDAAKVIGALLKLWQEQEQEQYLLIMEMIRGEHLSTLEEDVYQARSDRLRDLGLLPAVEAQSLYAPVDSDSFQPGGKNDFELEAEGLSDPSALLQQGEPAQLLAEILSGGISHATACELLLLLNRKMCADRVDLSSSQQVQEAIQSAYDMLNLALEQLAGTDPAQAQRIFFSTYLIRLFQLGNSLLQQRINLARQISRGPIYAFLDYPELLFIDSLLQKPPFLYLAADAEKAGEIQPIRTIQDLRLIDQRLEQIVALTRMVHVLFPDGLPVTEDNQAEAPTLAQIFITATANQLLGKPFSCRPLQSEELSKLKNLTLVQGSLKQQFSRQVEELIEHHSDNCHFFTDFCLELWQDSLNHVDPDQPVPASCAFILA